jgi:hypothetical protein
MTSSDVDVRRLALEIRGCKIDRLIREGRLRLSEVQWNGKVHRGVVCLPWEAYRALLWYKGRNHLLREGITGWASWITPSDPPYPHVYAVRHYAGYRSYYPEYPWSVDTHG